MFKAGDMIGRSIFADLNEGTEPGIPDGLKVDGTGRVYCESPPRRVSPRSGQSGAPHFPAACGRVGRAPSRMVFTWADRTAE
jgi:sugar lactone lactonase YvrE